MTPSSEPVMGGGRSLLQSRGGYRDRYREKNRQPKIKDRAGIYAPVEFKVFYYTTKAVPALFLETGYQKLSCFNFLLGECAFSLRPLKSYNI